MPNPGDVPIYVGPEWTTGPNAPKAEGAIIYRPGTPSGTNHVATWAEVRAFLAAQAGTPTTVVVDDSVVSPATDATMAGTTNLLNATLTSNPAAGLTTGGVTLGIFNGAVFQNLSRITGYLFVEGQSSSSVVADPAVNLFIEEGSTITNEGTAPFFHVSAGQSFQLWLEQGSYINDSGTPVIQVDAGATSAGVIVGDFSGIDDNTVTGAGAFTVVITSPSASFDPFQQPGATALTFLDYTNNNIVYQPGGTPGGLFVNAWEDVKSFIALKGGACIVYVDDSFTSPALVGAGVTECYGRVELRPFKIDSINYSVLEIPDGATLSNLYQVTDLELRLNCQSATKSLTWTGTPSGGFLLLWQFGYLSQATAATQPGIAVAAGQTVLITADMNGTIAGQDFNDITVPIVTVAAGGDFQVAAYNNSDIFPNFAEGAGNALLEYDDSSASFFFPVATPPALPALTGTYTTERNGLTTIVLEVGFAFNTASPLVLIPVNAGSIVTRAQIQIGTPFNDPAATLLFGTSATPNLIMAASNSDPDVSGTYDQPTMVTIPANDKLQLTITPGTSTQGTGILYYEIRTT